MDIISYYMTIYYLNCLLKAATSLKVSNDQQWQAAANFDVSPNGRGDNIGICPVSPVRAGVAYFEVTGRVSKNVLLKVSATIYLW